MVSSLGQPYSNTENFYQGQQALAAAVLLKARKTGCLKVKGRRIYSPIFTLPVKPFFFNIIEKLLRLLLIPLSWPLTFFQSLSLVDDLLLSFFVDQIYYYFCSYSLLLLFCSSRLLLNLFTLCSTNYLYLICNTYLVVILFST